MPIRADGIQLGMAPRFTAITTSTKVRDGVGICVALTMGIAAGAGGTIQLFDGDPNGTGVAISPLFDATKGPGTFWIYQDFKNGLFIRIAVAVTDCVVITGGE